MLHSVKHEPGLEAAVRESVGLLVIRAWMEHGSSEPLRAEVRVTTDVSAGFERTLNLARADEVGAAVQVWLDGIIIGPQQV